MDEMNGKRVSHGFQKKTVEDWTSRRESDIIFFVGIFRR